jgi:glutaconate CoA-transferase subunit A
LKLERRSKLISLPEAGKMIASRKILALAGATFRDCPMALIREAIRAGASELTVIPPIITAIAADLLIAAKCVSTYYTCYTGFEFLGLAPAFRRAGEAKSIHIIEADELFTILGARAAAGGWPFVAVPPQIYEATVLPKLNPFLRRTKDPYTGEEVITIPPLKSDVFIFHAQQADEYGNAQVWETERQELDKAKAADLVIVSTEKLVSVKKTRENRDKTTVSGHLVDAVVHVPFGAHPTASTGHYRLDEKHLKLYHDLVSAGREKEYLSRFVFEPKDHIEYLECIGLKQLLELRQ